MGYEMKFYVVNKTTFKDYKDEKGKEYRYASIIAMFDYSKDYDLADFIDKNSEPTDCYIFAKNGDEETIKDCYGDYLKEISISKLLNYLDAHNDIYRRYYPFKKMLEAFKEQQQTEQNFEDLVVLRYGY